MFSSWFEALDEFSTNFNFIFLFKYSWHFRTFGKAEYFGWNGMPIIGKTNHATELVAFEWRLSRKIFKTFKLLAKNQKKARKSRRSCFQTRFLSVFDPFWSIMSLAEDIQLIAGGNRWHWHKWKIIGNNFQHREFGAFPENISENDENFKNKIYRGGQLQCWWFLLLLRWFSVPLLSVSKNTHF